MAGWNSGEQSMNRRRRSLLKTGSGVTLLVAAGREPGSFAAACACAGAILEQDAVRHAQPSGHDEGARRRRAGAEQGHHLLPDAGHRRERRRRAGRRSAATSRRPSRSRSWSKRTRTWWLPCSTFPPAPSRRSRPGSRWGRRSNIVALVKADGKYYVASKEIKVTLGGCGG